MSHRVPEIRQDPISGRWVIVAENRHGRPEEFRRAPVVRVELSCPFCRGHEDQSPPSLAWYGPDRQAPERWEVRVVPNKYPALTGPPAGEEGDANPWMPKSGVSLDPPSTIDAALFKTLPGLGRHEVVIESPVHVASFSELSDDQAFWTLCAYRDRLLAHRGDPCAVSPTVFKNFGPEAGASLVHAHSQILFLPQTPPTLQQEIDGAGTFLRRYGECVFCSLAAREAELGLRIVARNERFLAFCPYASQFAYEMWILPRRHTARFEDSADDELRDAASLLKQVIQALETVLDRPAYNYFLHTAPFDSQPCEHYHWHIELFPRVTKAAGFEWSSGWRLNAVPPERAAEALARAAAH
jgi:UDPglucose--hexose-1-phosphate uridylyltransferase